MKIACLILLISFIFFNGCKSSILDDPSTIIQYSILERSHIKLSVENSYNTLIATLVDRELQAGTHEVNFDSSNLAEGIYFYTLEVKGLETGSYSKTTHHMMLIK